jgi:hypothetical protein
MYFHFQVLFKVLRLSFSRGRFSFRHAFFVVVFITLFLLLRTLVWFMRLLDDAFFPAYRRQPLEKPIFIVGNPRSGTTFLHRLISHDQQFSYFKLYHTIFPAVVLYRAFAYLGKLDRLMGNLFGKILQTLSGKGFRGWSAIHRTGLEEAESDEMLFVYAMLSPLVGLLFPFFDELDELKYVDSLPRTDRLKLMGYYRDCLQRHVYATGPDRTLLEKVALIGGRLEPILEVLPDMRIIHLVRHPYESIPSLISMFYVPWKFFSPRIKKDSEECRAVAGMIFQYYRRLLQVKRILPNHQFLEIRYENLVANPQGTVESIYRGLGLEIGDEYRAVLAEETEKALQYKSKHTYTLEEYGLTKQMVYEELQEVFEEYGFEPDMESA